MFFRTASLWLAQIMSAQDARGPEDYEAGLEARAPATVATRLMLGAGAGRYKHQLAGALSRCRGARHPSAR